MRFATREGKVVDAADARHRQGYLCPNCGGDVFLRSGKTREAHFAHYEGAGTAECREYHPSGSIEGSSAASFEVEEAPNKVGITVVEGEDTWALYLRLPELDSEALGHAPLSSLLPAHVDVLAGGISVARLGAIELRPGVGACRVAVPPSADDYRCTPVGLWPSGVERTRWAATADGLSPRGTLFRFKGGEWVRLRPGSSVTWGEELLLVSDEAAPPPGTSNPRPCGAGVHLGPWRLWRVALPGTPEDASRSWALGLGHGVAPLVWEVSVVSIPGARGETRHSASDPVLLRLVPPLDAADGTLTVRKGLVATSVALDVDQRGAIFASVHADSGRVEVSVEEDRGRSVYLEFDDPVDAGRLKSLMRGIPHLVVSVSGTEHEAWLAPVIHFQPRLDEIRLETGAADRARIDVDARTNAGRRTWRGLSPRVAERTIAEILPDAVRIEVDAGNLGRVVLVRQLRATTRPAPHSERLLRWLRAADSASGRAVLADSGSLDGARCSVRPLDARLRPLMIALARRGARGPA